jgi:hypothetical protein
MTKLEREKFLLSLNSAQRLAMLFTLSNFLQGIRLMSPSQFEDILRAYHPIEKIEDGELAPLTQLSMKKRGPGRHRHERR